MSLPHARVGSSWARLQSCSSSPAAMQLARHPRAAVAHATRIQVFGLRVPSNLAFNLDLKQRARVLARVTEKETLSETQATNGEYAAAKELQRTRKALDDALAKMALLKEQVAVVNTLNANLAEQDVLIAKLQEVIKSSKTEKPSEELTKRIKQLEADLAKAEAAAKEAAEAQAKQAEDLRVQLNAAESVAAALRTQVEEVEGARKKLEKEVEEAKAAAEETTAKLATKQSAYTELEEDLKRMRKMAAAQAAAAAAATNGPANGGGFGANTGRGGNGSRGKKGRNGNNGNNAQDARVPSTEETQLKKALALAQEEIELLGNKLNEREAALAAANTGLEPLKAQSKQQAAQLATAQQEVAALKQQLAEVDGAGGGIGGNSAQEELVAQLRAQLSDAQRAKADQQSIMADLKSKIEAATTERQKAVDECARLRKLLADVEAVSTKQSVALSSLEEDLQSITEDVQSAAEMRADLLALDDALKQRTQQLARVQDELKDALQRESNLQGELVGAREGMIRLQSMVGDMNKANNELMREMEALQANLRSKDRSTSSAQNKAQEAEKVLVDLSEQVMSLKTELGYKTQALAEAGARLKVVEDTSAAQGARMQELQAQLDEARRQAAQAQQQNAGLSAVEKARLSAAEAQLLAKEAEADELRKLLADMVAENEKLVASLNTSDSQLEAVKSSKEAQATELQEVLHINSKLSKEIERLQQVASASRGPSASDIAASEEAAVVAERQKLSEELAVTLAQMDKQLGVAMAEKEQAESEAERLRVQLVAMTQQVEVMKVSSSAQGAGSTQSLALATTEGLPASLIAAVQEEAQAANALLEKAESLIRAAAEAERNAAGSSGGGLSRDQVAELVRARDLVLATRAESTALRERIAALEKAMSDKDAQVAQLTEAFGMGGNAKLQHLAIQVQDLTTENTKLKQATATRDQVISQARRFVQAKVDFLDGKVVPGPAAFLAGPPRLGPNGRPLLWRRKKKSADAAEQAATANSH